MLLFLLGLLVGAGFVLLVELAGLWFRLRRWSPFVVALVLLSAIALPASAQDVGAPGWGNIGVRWGSYTWLQYVYTADAADRAPVPGARLQGSVTFSRLMFGGRLDTSATAANGSSYSSLEGYALGAARVAGPVAVSGVYGYQRPAFGSTGQAIESYGGGLLVGDILQWDRGGDPYVWVGMLKRRSSDPATPLVGEPVLRPALTLQVPTRDRSSVVADVLLGRGWMVRAGIAYRIR